MRLSRLESPIPMMHTLMLLHLPVMGLALFKRPIMPQTKLTSLIAMSVELGHTLFGDMDPEFAGHAVIELCLAIGRNEGGIWFE